MCVRARNIFHTSNKNPEDYTLVFVLQLRPSPSLLLSPAHARDLGSGEDEIGILKPSSGADALSAPRAAINHQRVGGDIVGGIAEQKHRGVGDLFDQPPSAQGDTFARVIAGLGVLFLGQALHAFGAGDGAGRDHVGSDSQGAIFDGDVVGERVDAGLGHRHVRLQGEAGVVDRGGNVDDTATGAGGR